jgi:hypothetical protein
MVSCAGELFRRGVSDETFDTKKPAISTGGKWGGGDWRIGTISVPMRLDPLGRKDVKPGATSRRPGRAKCATESHNHGITGPRVARSWSGHPFLQ